MSFYSGTLLFTAAAAAALGLFVFWQGTKKATNLRLALLSASAALWCFGQFMGEAAAGREAVLFWTRVNIAAAIFIPVFYFHFSLAFTERIKNSQFSLRLAYLLAFVLLSLDFTPWFVAGVAPRLAYRYYPVPGPVYIWFAGYLVVFIALGFFQLLDFLLKSEGPARNQAKYLLIASLIGFAGGITAFFPVFNINLPVVSQFALPLYLAITAYAMVRHQLFDVNVVIREGLIYSTLTVLFTGFYALAILAANLFFQNLTRLNEFLTAALAVFASVIIFQPLRSRVQEGVDRIFFRGSYYYQKKISDLSAENLKLYRGLLQADKLAALGTIAAGMAHEIKNPLAAIKGLSQILPENLADPEFIKNYSDIVPRQLDRINRIVENLLAFGQPRALVRDEIEVEEVLNDVLNLIENQCRKSSIEIVRKFSALPPVWAEAEGLTQAFMNIVLNAIQAMPAGGQLSVRTCRLGGSVIIEFRDTGAGIPRERLPNIFDPFYTTKEGGSGLGLAVTYRIIKEHGGEIEVRSEAGRGAEFKICLPIKPGPSA